MSETAQDPVGVSPEPTTMRLPSVGERIEGGHEGEYLLSSADESMVEALRPCTALLVVLRGANTGARFLLDDSEISIGRQPDRDIFLDDVTVSREHAVFRRTPECTYEVVDVGSLNGTYVNREIVESAELRTGDEVQIGKFRLVYYAARRD
ncbi:MAG: FHA domain-containing protein [Nostocoides sp.]